MLGPNAKLARRVAIKVRDTVTHRDEQERSRILGRRRFSSVTILALGVPTFKLGRKARKEQAGKDWRSQGKDGRERQEDVEGRTNGKE